MQLATLKHSVLGFVLVLLSATTSIACMCGDTPTVTDARDSALMVFSGKVVDAEYRDGAYFPNGKSAGSELTAHFRVDRWWKGEPLPDIFLFTEQYQAADYSISVSTCAYQFEVGKRYLVYAGFFLGRLRAIYCSRTSVIEKATEDLEVLGKGRPPVIRSKTSFKRRRPTTRWTGAAGARRLRAKG